MCDGMPMTNDLHRRDGETQHASFKCPRQTEAPMLWGTSLRSLSANICGGSRLGGEPHSNIVLSHSHEFRHLRRHPFSWRRRSGPSGLRK